MYRSPPNLRSGIKGQSVLLATPADKQKPRSLSVPDCQESTAMQNTDKTTQPVIDPAVIAGYVDSHLANGDTINTLVTRLTAELRSVVEEAVKTALTAVNQEVSRLRDRVRVLEDRLTERTDELEQYTRRNNVRFFGIPETEGEDTDAIVVKLCRDKLGVELREEALCRTHRVGRQPQPGPKGEKKHRPIIVRFVSYRDRRLVYGAKKLLK